MTSDAELLRRFAIEGDEPAFAELVQRQVNLVYSAALRQVGGDSHLAEDVTQGVFLALARSAGRLQDRPVLTGWLYTTTRFLAAKAVRAQQRWQRREQEAQTMHEILSDGSPDWAQLRPVIDETMHELGAKDCEALLLRYFEDRPFSEVGQRCGLSENSARMRVERALEKLRVGLARRGITSTSAALGTVLAHQAVSAAPAGLGAVAATAALAGSAGVGGTAAIGLMQIVTKQNIAAIVAVALLGTGIYVVSENRLEAKLAAEGALQDQEIVRWRTDNRSLEAENQRLTTALAETRPTPPSDPMARLREVISIAANLNVAFFSGPEFRPDGVPLAVTSDLIELFDLDPDEASALNQALEVAAREISALTIAHAVVTRTGNQLQIEIPASPEAEESYARMQAAFHSTLGDERYAFYEKIGWSTPLRNKLAALGLEPQTMIMRHNQSQAEVEAAVATMGPSMQRGVASRGYQSFTYIMQIEMARGDGSRTMGPSRPGLGLIQALVPSDF